MSLFEWSILTLYSSTRREIADLHIFITLLTLKNEDRILQKAALHQVWSKVFHGTNGKKFQWSVSRSSFLQMYWECHPQNFLCPCYPNTSGMLGRLLGCPIQYFFQFNYLELFKNEMRTCKGLEVMLVISAGLDVGHIGWNLEFRSIRRQLLVHFFVLNLWCHRLNQNVMHSKHNIKHKMMLTAITLLTDFRLLSL